MSTATGVDATSYDVNLVVIFDEHPWLEFVLDPVVEIFGWQFDYHEIGLSLTLVIACLFVVYLLFLPQRVSMRSFMQTTLPARVYLHPSSRIDYICLFVYPALLTLLSYAGFELVSSWQVITPVAQSHSLPINLLLLIVVVALSHLSHRHD